MIWMQSKDSPTGRTSQLFRMKEPSKTFVFEPAYDMSDSLGNPPATRVFLDGILKRISPVSSRWAARKTVVSQHDFQFILMAPFPPFPRRDGMWIAHRLGFDSLATCQSLIPAPCPCRTLHVRKAAHISRPRRTTPTILRV